MKTRGIFGSSGMLPQIRQTARQILAGWYQRRFDAQWNRGQQLKVLIETGAGFTANDWIKALNSDFDGWEQLLEVRFVRNSLERYALAPGMDVYVSTWLTSDLLARSRQLRWVHLTIAGVEFLEELEIPPHVKITIASGVAAEGIAEHVIGLMIVLDRRLDLAIKQQQRWVWNQEGIVEHIRGLRGRTVGVVGLGHNGQAVARLAKAVGMRVIGLTRQPEQTIEEVEVVYGLDGLPTLLSQSDFVVMCVPLTRETHGLVGKAELDALGHDSYLINVARGGVVDERDLAWALRKGIIAGAALDVLSVEPPSGFHPLRRCPNLIITPHVAGNIYTFRHEIRRRFVHNLKAFVSGGELEGLYQHV